MRPRNSQEYWIGLGIAAIVGAVLVGLIAHFALPVVCPGISNNGANSAGNTVGMILGALGYRWLFSGRGANAATARAARIISIKRDISVMLVVLLALTGWKIAVSVRDSTRNRAAAPFTTALPSYLDLRESLMGQSVTRHPKDPGLGGVTAYIRGGVLVVAAPRRWCFEVPQGADDLKWRQMPLERISRTAASVDDAWYELPDDLRARNAAGVSTVVFIDRSHGSTSPTGVYVGGSLNGQSFGSEPYNECFLDIVDVSQHRLVVGEKYVNTLDRESKGSLTDRIVSYLKSLPRK